MGNACGGGGSKQDPKEQQANKQIEEQMADKHAEEQQVIKLLLLGAGESGKSTIFKQFQQLYTPQGITTEEKAGFLPTVYNNTIQAIKTLSTEVGKYGGLKSEGAKAAQQAIDALHGDEAIDATMAKNIDTLWKDPGIQETYAHSSEYQISDSAGYFMERVLEIGAEGYEPTFQDMLRIRVRTTGIVESKFTLEGSQFAIYDVGGQRNERKKWIHCFEAVTAVLFVCGASGYDQVLFEDERTNRLEEAINLFDETCNLKYFVDTSMILFLNKRDIFQEKLKRVPLKKCFPDYTGDNSFDDAIEFIKGKFESKNKGNRSIYTHVTTATDTKNVSAVFNAVRDIVINSGLNEAGL